MASVNFYLRSANPEKDCTVWCRFRDKQYDIRQSLSDIKCKPKDWKDGRCKSSSKKMRSTDQETINVTLAKLEAQILSEYNTTKPEVDVKEWLKTVIDPQYSASSKPEVSNDVIEFCDIYISVKKDHVTQSTIKKVNVVKNLLIRYVADRKDRVTTFRKLRFSDLDNVFRDDFIKFCNREEYSLSTTFRNLKFIKMIARVAATFDIEINPHLDLWKFELEKATKDNPKSIYLSPDELKKIEKKEMEHNYLENAKDWLLIACNTGQRVGDYMRFTSEMIVEDSEGQKYIEFTQQKTNKVMRLPLLKKVQEILDKRNGEFPRAISAVKFNLYIKEVCKIAEINEMIDGGKTLTKTVSDDRKRTRKIFSTYPKYELVTSHIGRKSFATNFYEIIPTAYLLNFTGHTTEKQFLNYINKSDVEKARSTAEIFNKLGY